MRIGFDNDDVVDGADDLTPDVGAAVSGTPEPVSQADRGKGPKVFTQHDLDFHIKERLKKETKKYEQLEGMYRTALDDKNLTETQRGQLQETLESIRNEFKTKEERLAEQLVKEKQAVAKNLESLTGERDSWKTRYETTEIRRALSDAAIANDAYHAEQILAILQPRTKMLSLVDETTNNPTGELAPRVHITEIDSKTGEIKERAFTAHDAVEWMRSKPEYANLFRSAATGGLGGQSGTGSASPGKKVDAAKMSPSDYRKMRKSNPNALYQQR